MNPKTKKLYQITASKEQLEVVQEACEVFARLQLGQWNIIFDLLPLKTDMDYKKYHQVIDTIRAMMPGILKDGMDGYSSSFGVAHSELSKTNGVAIDIRDVIRHKLSWEDAVEKGVVESENSPRKFMEMLGINYDPPYHWGNEDLIKISKIN